jgi:hypothetical protein
MRGRRGQAKQICEFMWKGCSPVCKAGSFKEENSFVLDRPYSERFLVIGQFCNLQKLLCKVATWSATNMGSDEEDLL